MQLWLITLSDPTGVTATVETSETQFVVGTETATDVFTVTGEGVIARHAWICISEKGLQVEDMGGGTLVNEQPITECVQVEYPARVQVGEVALVIELRAAHLADTCATPTATDITIPRRATAKGNAGMDITISQRTPMRPKLEAGAPSPTTSGHAAVLSEASNHFSYTLVREIARGGMGKIFFADDSQLERHVAVKVSSVSEGGEDPRFTKEARILAQLAHPNIVPIHNLGVDSEGRPFYSMKLIRGRTLQAVLNLIREGNTAEAKEYSKAALLTIFRKVCDAMMFAHSKGILHRDLKPENIMVGEYGEVLVMDWGLAKIMGENEQRAFSVSRGNHTGEYGMTMEGEVMGTPQYMSPEQADGMVAELDQRSDIYSLGGILYAILTLRPPIDGTTLDEVLTKVRKGIISSMVAGRGGGDLTSDSLTGMEAEVPEALQAVTLKAMATDREKRYKSVEHLAADIELYQNGFATQAEDAGTWRRLKLWLGRNKVLAGSAAAMLVTVSGFTARVVQKGREASLALKSLRETAPTFAVRSQDALREGQFEEALKAATFAVQLESQNGEYHMLRGNVLQVLVRWSEAFEEYQTAARLGLEEKARVNLTLTEELIAQSKTSGVEKAKAVLFEALNAQGRQYEAMELGKGMGDFWKEQKRDANALPELIRRLEAKLLPVPGNGVLMCKTEMTVGEWKLYLKAEGLPEWNQPEQTFEQNDEHPVVKISWNRAKEFCDWLSAKTGREWRLPTNAEWEAAAGTTNYPWGDHFPPTWEDGNYLILQDGTDDQKMIGVDGVYGTAPVGSFKPNALGFYDIGGNVWEWMLDGGEEKNGTRIFRGGGWNCPAVSARLKGRQPYRRDLGNNACGFRLVQKPGD